MLIAATGLAFWNKPSWGAAEAWAVVILLVPSLVSTVLVYGVDRKNAYLFKRLITGRDGRWSTSKAGYLLWTYVILFAGLAMLLHLHNLGDFDNKFKQEYLLVLGLPAAAAAAAKGIRNASQPADVQATTPSAPVQTNIAAGIGELLTDDDGDTALHKFQYLAFNLLLIGVFLASFLSAESLGWPNLPDTLVGLTGVAAAAYVAGKGLDKTVSGPVIRDVVPRKGSVGAAVRIYAVNVATPTSSDVRVTFDGIEAGATVTIGDAVTTIATAVPSGVLAGPATIRVIAYDGHGVDWTDFTVV